MVELMAPAGSLEGARTALAAGADAVYAGLTNLSLRPARAEFNDEEFAQIVSLAHDRSKKVYAVLNVFLKDEDLALFDSELAAVNRMGADAVLVADAGAIEAVRTRYPNLPIHVSVQNSVTTPETAKFYERLGASVIVLSRNTTDFSEIKRIGAAVDCDIEVFLHGGICYHFDGDCFLSSFFSQEVAFDRTLGRNRLFGQNNAKGECHLICKRPCNAEKAGQTNSARFMRRDDLVGLDKIPGYVDAGVTIFKIEGRAMPVSYVGAATKLYREAIDLYEASPADYRIRPDWSDALKQLLEARRQYERDWQIR